MKSSIVLAFACLTFTTTIAFTQEPVKPSKEHEFLKESVGEWDIKFDMADGSVSGKAVYKMVHGDLWLASDLEMPKSSSFGIARIPSRRERKMLSGLRSR